MSEFPARLCQNVGRVWVGFKFLSSLRAQRRSCDDTWQICEDWEPWLFRESCCLLQVFPSQSTSFPGYFYVEAYGRWRVLFQAVRAELRGPNSGIFCHTS
jgi:hypothetical protein